MSVYIPNVFEIRLEMWYNKNRPNTQNKLFHSGGNRT